MPTIDVFIDRQQRFLAPGAQRGQDIMKLAAISDGEHVLLEGTDGRRLPVLPDDIFYIQGGETFSVARGEHGEDTNPQAPRTVTLTIDGKPQVTGQPTKWKVCGLDLKVLAGAEEADLWVELEHGIDELVNDADLIVLHPNSRFFTAPRDEEDRFYEVTVILDGDDRQRRFPSGITVLNALRRSLPARDRAQVGEFDMVDANVGTAPLAHDLTLKAAGVRDGHILSITKKNGGGG